MKKRIVSKAKIIKSIVQVLFLLFVLFLVVTKTAQEAGVQLPFVPGMVPGLHSVCPFGAVESMIRLISEGNFIPKTYSSNLWVLLGALGTTLLFGSLFCGWLCPLGTVQEWLGKLGKKILKTRFNNLIPKKLDHILGYLRYSVLGIVLLKTTEMIALVFAAYDPYYALFHFWTGNALPTAILVLLAVLISSFFIARPWCRWFCPFGAVQGIIQLVSPWKIRRNKNICINCGKCSRFCPMRIDVHKKTAIYDTRCNKCGECLTACPVEKALSHALPGGKAGLNNRLLSGVLSLVLFFTPLVAAHAAGVFYYGQPLSPPVLQSIQAADITSAMTLAEVATGFGISLEEVKSLLGLSQTLQGSIKIRDLEDLNPELTTRAVREILQQAVMIVPTGS